MHKMGLLKRYREKAYHTPLNSKTIKITSSPPVKKATVVTRQKVRGDY